MANRDESHLFSLAALTTRAPAPPPGPPSPTDDTGGIRVDAVPEPTALALGASFAVFPLGAPIGNHEPLAPAPKPEVGRARTLALVASALLVGAGIVLVALWSSQSPEPPPSLARPEVVTDTLVPPPTKLQSSRALAPPPEAVSTATEPATEQTSAAESQFNAHAPHVSSRPRPRPNLRGEQALARPAPARTPSPAQAPARGPCAHCSPHDLACNIKCRAH